MLSETPASYSENHAFIFSASDAVLWSHILRSSWLYNITYPTLVSELRPAHAQCETETYWISGWWHTLRRTLPNEIEQNNVPDGLYLTVSVMSAADAGYVKASVMSAPLLQQNSAIKRGKQCDNNMFKKWNIVGKFCTLLYDTILMTGNTQNIVGCIKNSLVSCWTQSSRFCINGPVVAC